MNIKIRKDNEVELISKHNIEETVSQYKDIFDLKITLPRTQHLWDLNNETELLDNLDYYLFHLLISKLIYITNRTIPDLEPAVPLLTTRNAKRNSDDCKKLRICISYQNETVNNVKIIGFLIHKLVCMG